MVKKSKRLKKALELVVSTKKYTLSEALKYVEEYRQCQAKFDETVEIVFKLGVDPKQSNQIVRGSVPMPHGLGKSIKVAVFAPVERHNEANAAGADIVGAEELIEKVKSGKIEFDACIATPDMMPKMAILGKVLGPRGIMPNPKLGTVDNDVTGAIKRLKSGQTEYKTEKAGLVHAGIGKLSFDKSALYDNILALYNAIKAAKPEHSKGIYMRKAYLGTSQGPSVEIEVGSFV